MMRSKAHTQIITLISNYTEHQLEAAFLYKRAGDHPFELSKSRQQALREGLSHGMKWCTICHLAEDEHP